MFVIFIDSNILLQCNEITTLEWMDIIQTDAQVYIPREVQSEIDKNKNSGNKRLAKKARSANSFFKKLLDDSKANCDIYSKKIKVNIAFSPVRIIEESYFKDLDRREGDDKIVAEALKYKTLNKLHVVKILTDDVGMKLSAKSVGIDTINIPSNWFLNPEKDDRDKQILQLKEEIGVLRNQHPKIEIIINGSLIKDDIFCIEKEITLYKKLSEAEVGGFVEKVSRLNPIIQPIRPSEVRNVDDPLARFGIKLNKYPTQEEIDEYINVAYPKWLTEVEDLFANLHDKIWNESNIVNFNLRIENQGTLPAKSLKVLINAKNGLTLVKGDLEKVRIPKYPIPPRPVNIFDTLANNMNRPGIELPLVSSDYDVNKLYAIGNTLLKFNGSFNYACDIFPHQQNPHELKFKVIIPNLNDKEYTILLKVAADNIPAPVNRIIKIQTKNFIEKDTKIIATELISSMNIVRS